MRCLLDLSGSGTNDAQHPQTHPARLPNQCDWADPAEKEPLIFLVFHYRCHTTAFGSPTRAALITRRNHPTCSTRVVTESATGYDGCRVNDSDAFAPLDLKPGLNYECHWPYRA